MKKIFLLLPLCALLFAAKRSSPPPPVCNITLVSECCIKYPPHSNKPVKTAETYFKMTGTVTNGSAYLKFEKSIKTGGWMSHGANQQFSAGSYTMCFAGGEYWQKYRIALVDGNGNAISNSANGTKFPLVFPAALNAKCVEERKQ